MNFNDLQSCSHAVPNSRMRSIYTVDNTYGDITRKLVVDEARGLFSLRV